MINHNKKPLLITTGDPAGIGMDIVLDVLCYHTDKLIYPIMITADKSALLARAKQLNLDTAFLLSLNDIYTVSISEINKINFDTPAKITLIDIVCPKKVIAGVLNPYNAVMVEQQLFLAHQLAINKKIRAIITAPIAKSAMIEGGVSLADGSMFSGHTEYFMALSNLDKVVMMLANSVMKVALVTTHLPLKDVARAITAEEIKKTVDIVYHSLASYGVSNPKILVCGLNPHAGENGYLGTEEIDIINPVLQSFKDNGMDISLSMPADTVFTQKHLQNTDVVIAMYHDQGLAPIKSHGFGDTVNVTLGLPYVRTSVDHGTALDLAGTGRANSQSLICAITLADKYSQ